MTLAAALFAADWTPADPDRIARLRAAMTEKEDHA